MGFCITDISMLQLVYVKKKLFYEYKYPSTVLEASNRNEYQEHFLG